MKTDPILEIIALVEVASAIDIHAPEFKGTSERMLQALSPDQRALAERYMQIKLRAVDEATRRMQATTGR